MEDNLKDLVVTFNPGDIAFIKSVLMAADIPFVMEGETFMQVRPLVQPAVIRVPARVYEEAKELLKDFKSGKFGYQVD